jgi:hypothetical protein
VKRAIILIILAIILSGLHAQSGLFRLSYDQSVAAADSILRSNNMIPKAMVSNKIEYVESKGKYLENMILFVKPGANTIIGWSIKYRKTNTAEMDSIILNTLVALHGDKNHYDEATDQLIWFLTDVRSVHVMYSEDQEMIILYYDSFYDKQFKKDGQ